MAKTIMIQGTMSSAGKSLLCTALCRRFFRDGYRTAPFKSQNMSRNAHRTPEGLLLSRAQALQAEAAGKEPDVRMNPILLRPVTDRGSELIVMGQSRGRMPAGNYYATKHSLVPLVREALDSLAAENDILVLEGAGSPVEINLNSGDFVNMGLAKMARAPVLLVGDIDRGGVFAQLAGTLLLLSEDEKNLVKGLVINKFRGDPALLAPGLAQLENLCQKPVAGVLPWLDQQLEDEDSLSASDRGRGPEDFGRCGRTQREQQYELLAEAVQQHLNMDRIYQILEEGL